MLVVTLRCGRVMEVAEHCRMEESSPGLAVRDNPVVDCDAEAF